MAKYHYGTIPDINKTQIPVLGFTKWRYKYSSKPDRGWESNDDNIDLLNYINGFDSRNNILTLAMPGAYVPYFVGKDIEKLHMWAGGWNGYLTPIKFILEFGRATCNESRLLDNKKMEVPPIPDFVSNRFAFLGDLNLCSFAVTFTGVTNFTGSKAFE